MNNEIAGLSSPSISILTIRFNYSTRHKHFVLCVGTALRCKGGGGNSNEEYQQEYSPLYHNVDERDEKLKAEITLP
ncbi:hypothetical protein G4A65_15200 [Escherichia coli]|nr:hypothetical protein [Escherichia coli]